MQTQLINACLAGKQLVFIKAKDMNQTCEQVYDIFRENIKGTARNNFKVNLNIFENSVNYSITDKAAIEGDSLVEAKLSQHALILKSEPTFASCLAKGLQEIVNTLRPDAEGNKSVSNLMNSSTAPQFFDTSQDTLYLIPYSSNELINLPVIKSLLAVNNLLENHLIPSNTENAYRAYKYMMMFVVPENFKVPDELDDIAHIIDYELPEKQDILYAWADIIYSLPLVKLLKKINKNTEKNEKVVSDSLLKELSYFAELLDDLERDETIENIYEHEVFKEKISTNVETLQYVDAFSGLSYNEAISIMDDLRVALRLGKNNKHKEIKFNTHQDVLSFIRSRQIKTINKSPAITYTPSVDVSELGGMNQVKKYIDRMKLALSLEAKEFGVKQPKGISLIGISGTGKSLGAKVVASSLGYGLVTLTLSDLLEGLVGSSEKNTTKALQIIESLGKVVVLVDEIDKSVNMNSGGGDSGVGDRLLGKLLTFMQSNEADLIWVFTANRTTNLPAELMRKGRIDEVFGVTFPTPQERLEVLKIHLKKRKQDITKIDEETLNQVVSDTNGFVPAELEDIVNQTILNAFIDKKKIVEYKHFKTAINETKPLAQNKSIAHDLALIEQWVKESARPAHLDEVTQEVNLKKATKRVKKERDTEFESLN